mgnify:CR=1 FL=1
MSETDRLLQLLDEYIAKAGPAFAHAMKTKELKALRALIAALANK